MVSERLRRGNLGVNRLTRVIGLFSVINRRSQTCKMEFDGKAKLVPLIKEIIAGPFKEGLVMRV